MSNIALIVAAGKGTRFGGILPKQYTNIAGVTILSMTIKKFIDNENIDLVKVVIHQEDLNLYEEIVKDFGNKLLSPAYGANNRQESVFSGLKSLIDFKPNKVLIHDGVRPYISDDLINKSTEKTSKGKGAIIGKRIYNTIKKFENGKLETLDRNILYSIETPQTFVFDEILQAHIKLQGREYTDDASLFEELGLDVEIIESNENNIKITTKEDVEMQSRIVVGSGFDAHKITEIGEEGFIKLGGVDVKFNRQIIAHSDGDVILHALVDAIFGAIGAGDIGMYFPPSDIKWKDADSCEFVKYAVNMLNEKQGKINNVDITLICEAPRIGKYRDQIREKIASLLNIDSAWVNIKATTTEKMGFTGRGEGIAAQAVIAIELVR